MLTHTRKADAVRRLRRIEGQVRGIADMVDSERYCVDVLTQIAAVHEALRSVGKQLVENHLATCVSDVVATGTEREREAKLHEFVETMYRFVR